jgi:membrane protease YdiL (CAAX protease family)
MTSSSISSILLSTLIGAAMVTGAIFLHDPDAGFLLMNGCFLFAAFLSGFGIERHPPLLLSRQLWTLRHQHRQILWISLAVAAVLGFVNRRAEGMPLLPEGLEWFVLLSMMIGATEELVFRGIIQGEAARWNATGAVFLAAFLFAVYKSALFLNPAGFLIANPRNIFFFTLPASLLLGFARKSTGSLWPPILAHMLFDLIVYADSVRPPWWVWG